MMAFVVFDLLIYVFMTLFHRGCFPADTAAVTRTSWWFVCWFSGEITRGRLVDEHVYPAAVGKTTPQFYAPPDEDFGMLSKPFRIRVEECSCQPC